MARIDLKNKAIQAKLVYYGPGLCGKTTNLQYINKHLAGGEELMSLATEGDRTIFFDFMPLGLGKLRGLEVQFKLYTVPGQVRYNQTRKMVLKNVDGVVFVADSQTEMIDANLESLDNLFENLRELGIKPDEVPVVLQYNKRDLPNVMSAAELDAALNAKSFSTFMASAYTGDGVVETLKAACKEVLGYLSKSLPGREDPTTTDLADGPASAGAAAGASARASAGTAAATPTPVNGSATQATAKQAAEKEKREQAPVQHDGLEELARSLAAAREEMAGLRAPASLDEDTHDKLAERLVTKADMVVLHRRVDGVEEAAQNAGTLVGQVLESLDAVAKQLSDLGGTLVQRLEKLPSAGGDLPAQLLKLPTKADLASLAKKLEKLDFRPETSSSSKADPKIAAEAVTAAVRDLAGRRELEAVSARLGGIADQLSKWDASRSALVASKQALEAAPRREDLAEIRAAMVKLATRPESSQAAPASPQPSAELGKLAAKLESLPTKAQLAAVTERLAALPTRGDLERLDKRLTEALAEVRALAADRGARAETEGQPAPVPEEATAQPEALPDAPAPADETRSPDAPADAAMAEEPAAAAQEGSAAPDKSEQRAADEAEQSAADKAEQSAADEAEQSAADEAEQSAADEAEQSAAEEPAQEPATETQPSDAAPGESAAEVDDDSPEHKNAARVARVMVADLYLYNKEQVETGIREGDFFDRNREALEDMRLTFESRVPDEVRAQKDHLRLAIEAFIEKKRAKLAAP